MIDAQVRCEREVQRDLPGVQVNVDLLLGEETAIQFAADFHDSGDLNLITYWGFGFNGSSNELMSRSDGAPFPKGELHDFIEAKAREAL